MEVKQFFELLDAIRYDDSIDEMNPQLRGMARQYYPVLRKLYNMMLESDLLSESKRNTIKLNESGIKKIVANVIKEVFDNTIQVADNMFYTESNMIKTIKASLERGGWEMSAIENSNKGQAGIVVTPIEGQESKRREITEIASVISQRIRESITVKPYFGMGKEGNADPYKGLWILYFTKNNDEYLEILDKVKTDFERPTGNDE